MKYNIAVCDDEKPEREYLSALVARWADARGLHAAVAAYDSAEALLFALEGDRSFDILLLDVQMRALDGISLAKTLRKTDDRTQIAFITGHPDFIAQGYEVSALHYLLKPVGERKLFDVLDRAAARLSEKPRVVTLEVGRISAQVRVDEIYYAEVFSHAIDLHTKTQVYRLYISLNELERLLGDGFFRCHRSYLVGLSRVRQVTCTAMVLEDGRELPLSRKLYDAANQKFIQFN